MAPRDEIERIRDRSVAALNHALDYFTYTRDPRPSIQQAVRVT